MFLELDEDAALKATTIEVGSAWSKSFQKGLLSKPANTVLDVEAL
jgi:hypothetical protein